MTDFITNTLFSDDSRKAQSKILIRLLKGPLYRARNRELWDILLRDQQGIRNYFQPLGLGLVLDDAEGFAFLIQHVMENEDDDFPRLIPKRNLTYSQSLLLVSLRKRLAEHDAEESAPRLIVTRQEMHSWLKPYLPEVNNEVKQQKEIDALIKKVCEMGFLTVLTNHPDEFEVQRIIKAMVSAEQINLFIDLFRERIKSQQGEDDSHEI
ncbi:DUF4194 domain-containing protein [Dryocola clanedunensis]|uniref:DUF4194 domain-containing protein n=1 Tax=Cedecea sulfonylureivorans TaxID=3051154 RepID=UPI001926064B|nr:DUF4194 domain-containing protein [Cedecea sulfonylureivorans]